VPNFKKFENLFIGLQLINMEEVNIDENAKGISETEAHSMLQMQRSIGNNVSSDEENQQSTKVTEVELPEDYYDCCYIGCKKAFHGPCDMCKDECGKVTEYCKDHYDHEIHKGKNKHILFITAVNNNNNTELSTYRNDLFGDIKSRNFQLGDIKDKDNNNNANDNKNEDEYKELYSLLVLAKIVRY